MLIIQQQQVIFRFISNDFLITKYLSPRAIESLVALFLCKKEEIFMQLVIVEKPSVAMSTVMPVYRRLLKLYGFYVQSVAVKSG